MKDRSGKIDDRTGKESRKESEHMDQILRTQNLCKYYGSGENEVRAVQNANIDIQKGEFVAIVGEIRFRKKYPASYAGRAGHTNKRQSIDPRQRYFFL